MTLKRSCANYGGKIVSDMKVQLPVINWNSLTNLVVDTDAPDTVASAMTTLVTAGAVPLGVLNVDVLRLISGLIGNDTEELLIIVHKILATVPFLYSAGGAMIGKMLVVI